MNTSAPPRVVWLVSLEARQRRAAWRYWVVDPLVGLPKLAVFHLFRHLPIDAGWIVGKVIGDVLSRTFLRPAARRARNNWIWLRPKEKDPKVIEDAVRMAFRNAAAAYLEFSILHRVVKEGRVSIEGLEHVHAAKATGRPVIVASVHTGMWEIVGPVLTGLGYRGGGIYMPPPNRFDHSIVASVRAAMGITNLQPGHTGTRGALRMLASGAQDGLVMFIDEYKGGRVPAPAFGREHRIDDNIAYAARLAGMTGAVILPAYCRRLDRGANFRMTFLPVMELSGRVNSDAEILENVKKLDAVFEPIVRANLDQWLLTFYLRRKK